MGRYGLLLSMDGDVADETVKNLGRETRTVNKTGIAVGHAAGRTAAFVLTRLPETRPSGSRPSSCVGEIARSGGDANFYFQDKPKWE